MKNQTHSRKKIVIIGAGFGGLAAAQHFKNEPVDVTLIDRRNYHLFQPLLYQVATAALSPAQIAQPIRAIMKRQKNCTVVLGEVVGIDTERRVVRGHTREIAYDSLIVATGSENTYFGHDDWSPFALGLKSVEDATAIRQRVLSAFEKAELTEDDTERQAQLTFVVIGGGPTGIEMAGAIAELARHTLVDDFKNIDTRKARIVLIEAGPRLLAAFPPHLSHVTQRDLTKMGVEVITGKPVTHCAADHVALGETIIPTRSIVWAAGVKASAAGTWLKAATDRAGRVIVEPDLSVTSHPDIFVIGDTSFCKDAKGIVVPGLAPPAQQQGVYAAETILRRLKNHETQAPFRYKDLGTMATIGRNKAIANFSWMQFSGFIAWVLWGGVHLIPLIGFRNRVVVTLDWLWSYVTHDRGVRLITIPKGTGSDL